MNTNWIRVHLRKSVAKFFYCGECGVAGLVIGIENGFDILCGLIYMIVHHGFDNLRDLSQTDSLVQKCADRLLVRGIHRGRQCPAFR